MAKCRSRVVFDFLFERLPIWALRFILFLVVVVAPFVHYGYAKTYLVDAQTLLLPGVLILGLALPLVTLMITRKYPAITGKFFVPLVLGGGVLLLCVQMFLVKGGLFETSWDVASVAIVHDRLNPDSLSYLRSRPDLWCKRSHGSNPGIAKVPIAGTSRMLPLRWESVN